MDRITEANDRLSNSTKQKYCAFINLFGLRIGGVYVLCFILLSILLTPDNLYAEEIDYQALQEDPLETAYRKLGSPGDIEWDEEEYKDNGILCRNAVAKGNKVVNDYTALYGGDAYLPANNLAYKYVA